MWVPNLLMHNDHLQGFHDPIIGYKGIKVVIKRKQWDSWPLQQMTTEWVICTTMCYKEHIINEWAPNPKLPHVWVCPINQPSSYHLAGHYVVKGWSNPIPNLCKSPWSTHTCSSSLSTVGDLNGINDNLKDQCKSHVGINDNSINMSTMR